MHPKTATLVAFCDAEFDRERGRRVAEHLQKCEKCQAELKRIETEKNDFSVLGDATGRAADLKRGLAAVLSEITKWRESGADTDAAAEVRSRVRAQIELYFGYGAAALVGRPDMRPDELLGKTLALTTAFLGPDAAEAVVGEILRELDCAELAEEVSR
jgi:anti-sigma factor RsiW